MSDLVRSKLDARAKAAISAVFVVVAALIFFGSKYQIGNMLAASATYDDPNVIEIANTAAWLAPNDPGSYALLASIENSPTRTIEFAKNAVRIAPYDHRFRVLLAKAYESEEMFAESEAEFREAIRLAPSNAVPRWHYGNFLLRRDRESEAIENLKIAANDNDDYREQVYSLVWEYYGRDVSRIEQMIGDRPDSIAKAAYFLAARGYGDESLRSWQRLSPEFRNANREVAKAIALGLFGQRHYAQALQFALQYGLDESSKPETITNGSFERPIDPIDSTLFGWRMVRGDAKLEQTQDGRFKREGNRSLRLNFKGFSQPTIPNLIQYTVVSPGTRYRLRLWTRSDVMRSRSLPFVEVVDGKTDRQLARSNPFAPSSSEWQETVVEFESPADSTGMYIRLGRDACGDDCLIYGQLWIDDVRLEKR